MRQAFAAFVILLLAPVLALAHAMPPSLVRLTEQGERIAVEAVIPLTELSAAMGREVTVASFEAERPALEAYLREHVSLRAPDNRAWPMRLEGLSTVQDHDHELLQARLSFTPPEGARGGFSLHYDPVMHAVMSHYALISFDRGQGSEPFARLQSPTTAVVIAADAPPPAPPTTFAERFRAIDGRDWAVLIGMLMALAIAVRGFRYERRQRKKRKP